MENIYIINTHTHVNMLKQTPVDDAVDDLKNQNMIGIVPSSTAEDIFEVDEFIKKYDNLYGYVGVFHEEVKYRGLSGYQATS